MMKPMLKRLLSSTKHFLVNIFGDHFQNTHYKPIDGYEKSSTFDDALGCRMSRKKLEVIQKTNQNRNKQLKTQAKTQAAKEKTNKTKETAQPE